ncbi:MAG: DUF6468 domain-containing protein [Alphaproteobacteria bacterium]
MTGAILNLLVNVIIVVLLVVTIGYCWVLNRRIRVLQDSKGELAQLLKHFDESTQRASESIIALQTASKKIGESIQQRAEKANFLLDDLAFMIEKAQGMTSKMEADIAISRARSRASAVTEQPPAAPTPEPKITQERSWLDRGDDEVMTRPASDSRERTVAALEAVLERAKRRSQESYEEQEPAPSRKPSTATAARSRSEKELLEMIRSGFKG